MNDIRGELPTWQEKKQLLYDRSIEVDPAFLAELGDRLRKADRLLDALEFYHRAGHEEGVASLRAAAVEQGNFFLCLRCADLSRRPADQEEVLRLAANAEARGRFTYALRAYRHAGDAEGEARARERLRGVLPAARLLFREEEDE